MKPTIVECEKKSATGPLSSRCLSTACKTDITSVGGEVSRSKDALQLLQAYYIRRLTDEAHDR